MGHVKQTGDNRLPLSQMFQNTDSKDGEIWESQRND